MVHHKYDISNLNCDDCGNCDISISKLPGDFKDPIDPDKFEARMAIHQAYVPQLVDFKISPIHIREVIVYAFPYMQK